MDLRLVPAALAAWVGALVTVPESALRLGTTAALILAGALLVGGGAAGTTAWLRRRRASRAAPRHAAGGAGPTTVSLSAVRASPSAAAQTSDRSTAQVKSTDRIRAWGGRTAWRTMGPSLALVALAAGVALASGAIEHRTSTADLADLDALGARVTVTGTLTAPVEVTTGTYGQEIAVLTVRAEELDARGRSGSVSGTVHATGPADLVTGEPASRTSAPALPAEPLPADSLAADPSPANSWLAGSRITVTGTLDGDASTPPFLSIARVEPASSPGAGWRDRLRERLADGLRTADPDASALVRGMAIGDVSGLAPETEDALQVSGLTHLVAVSGSNCAIVMAAVHLLLLPLRMPRWGSAAGALAALGAYVALVGPEPTVLRAAAMAALGLVGFALGTLRAALPLLASAVLLASWLVPQIAASLSFALSTCATAGVLVLAPVLTEWMVARRVPRVIAAGLAVATAAQAACTPVLLLISPVLTPYAFPANLLVAPLVAPITLMGMGAVVLLALPAAWGLAGPAAGLLHLAAWPARAVVGVAEVAVALPWAQIPWLGGAAGGMAFAAVVTGAVVLVRGLRHRAVRTLVVALALVAAGALVIAPRLPWNGRDASWIVLACDVGQGDAVLLRSTDGGYTMLIDTGPDPAALDGCLSRHDVDTIDALVLTHPHADHAGALEGLRGRAVHDVWRCPAPDEAWSAFALPAGIPAGAGTGPHAAATGSGGDGGDLSWTVIWPDDYASAERAGAGEDGGGGEDSAANDCSLVISAHWGASGLTYVGLGDLEPVAQARLARRLDPAMGAGAAIVKVAHHGSRRQDPGLYELLDPEIALVTVGENDYGHPHPDTLTMLNGLHASVWRTDEHGDVLLSRDGSGVRVR